MPYTPDGRLRIRGPAGDAALHIGQTYENDRTLVGAARTKATARGTLAHVYFLSGAATTRPARARGFFAYDPNLLSAVHAVTATAWQEATAVPSGLVEPLQPAPFLRGDGLSRWQPAETVPAGTVETWQPSERALGTGIETWQGADWAGDDGQTSWQQAGFVASSSVPNWQEGRLESGGIASGFQARLPLLSPETRAPWQGGIAVARSWIDRSSDGRRLIAVEIEGWQQAGYPSNARRSKPAPRPWQPYRDARLRIRCPLPGARLSIGRTPCVLLAERWIPERRSYMVVNSASLVRWPDLTPLPVTSMTVETDADSWCWGFSATLAGPDAYALVQPNPLACEVLATINGHAWKFLLDVPSRSRQFNRDRVTLKGRSRSAWLHSPYTAPTSGIEANAREMVQLAEQALDNLGWTLVWNIENWLVPAGRYAWHGTPIDRLMQLVGVTDDCLYTDPDLEVLTAYPRWPAASWLLDGATADVAVPESAILDLSQAPTYSQPWNGVYVSGTTHGAVALVKIAGTDGALQPAEPLVHELLSDATGAAARARGLNALSDSGAGTEVTAELLLVEPVGLIHPGLIANLAGVKGVSRSCRILATWSNGLQVRQTVGLERREVEA
ncbi:MAG: hypothetical protein RKP73_01805 [Candidatus Contendobacter sp.]|nr:hypothetical protein [Candidatus Contendobacter sp.]